MITNCPKCKSESIHPQKWTWWGGALGPVLIKSSKCDSCGATFNTNTGGSNTVGIVIYSVVVCVLAVVLTIALMQMM